MSDVPLGMFLSGGVDSSAIAAMMKRMTDGPVKTFAVGYAEEQLQRTGLCRASGPASAQSITKMVVGMDDFFNALPQLIWHEDEPITWPSSVSLYFVSRLAAEQVKVVLTGEGSDELFGGYERYRWTPDQPALVRRYWRAARLLRAAFVRQRLASIALLGAIVRRKLRHTFLGPRGHDRSRCFLDNFYCAFSRREQCAANAPPSECALRKLHGVFRSAPERIR